MRRSAAFASSSLFLTLLLHVVPLMVVARVCATLENLEMTLNILGAIENYAWRFGSSRFSISLKKNWQFYFPSFVVCFYEKTQFLLGNIINTSINTRQY